MKNRIEIFLFLFLLGTAYCRAQSNHILWYEQPAEYFEQCLVLGNGTMGATVFGGTTTEKIYLNDATLWSGEPVNPMMNPQAYKHIPAIRDALGREDYQLADSLQRNVQGSFSQSYAPLGTLLINFGHKGPVENYRRELDIEQAVATTRYETEGVGFRREYLVSHPDKVLAFQCSSDQPGTLNFTITFESLLRYKLRQEDDVLVADGYAPYHAEPSYRGAIADAVRFDPARGTRFSALVRVIDTDGRIQLTDSTLSLSNGSKATILVAVGSSFNGFDKNPATEGKDHYTNTLNKLSNASQKSYSAIRESHLGDYQSYYKRLSLDLGETSAPDLPTDERLKRYAEGKEDRKLEELYLQFGRYLLISSSRTEAVPANLQGIWNPHLRPPWSSNYTININAQENYWLAETGNLSELHRPLIGLIENIAATGAVTAKTFYGVGGWTAAHNSDIWAMSNPVGDFGKGDPLWANWTMGGAWLATHLWEHFTFNRDTSFLEEKAYPLLEGAARFCLEWLVDDGKGNLVTSPSTSPENQYLTPEGYRGATLYGATADLAIIRELFIRTIRASEIVGADPDFRAALQNSMSRLYPYQTGKHGQLLEWYHDWEDADPKHRHQSHLFGLHPGRHISPHITPDLAEASKKTLEIKGDETTGWSKGWRINLWARLWDGNRAYKLYRELLKYVPPDGSDVNYMGGGGTYPNLLDAHPPFQIDGNFGGAAGVLEMLLQSNDEEGFHIRLLPALPDAWKDGFVKGVRARGGFEVDMEWQDHALKNTEIRSQTGGRVTLIYQEKRMELQLAAGESKTISW